MTEDQLHALKCFIGAKIQNELCPSFANEQYLKLEEERLDREIVTPPAITSADRE
jgi:hypothetical protein